MLLGMLFCLTTGAWSTGALAAESGATVPTAAFLPEEITVYGDDFARWDGTRWLTESELVLPSGISFKRDKNQSFVSQAFQIRSVVACNKDWKLTKKTWEVSCEIEDIGLLASTYRRSRRANDRAVVQDVLDELDEKLTGARVQMQVDFEGGIPNVDLEGIVTHNQRQRHIQETLRKVVLLVMSGFHLRIPDHAQREGQWREDNPQLMQIPSVTASYGATTMVHLVTPYEGLQIVQMIGEGTTQVAIPTPKREIQSTYSMAATGVAIFDKSTGIMRERVWAIHGEPTASTEATPVFRNLGRLTLIQAEERPNVGATTQVAVPGKTVDGLPSWVPIDIVDE